MMKWPIEVIPDNDSVYYRVHQSSIIQGKIIPYAFREIGEGMSTDWAKYSTPQESRGRAKNPFQNAIVSLVVARLKNLRLEVAHSPTEKNRSHTNVKGIDVEIRIKLLEIYSWELQI